MITSALPAWAFWTLQVLLWIAQIPERGSSHRDFSQAAKLVIDIATGQVEDRPPTILRAQTEDA